MKATANYEVYRVILVTHDFFYYVSKELKVGVPADLIGNTALHYAFNRHIDRIHRIASGNRPFYREDQSRFEIYSTPAGLITGSETHLGPEYSRWLSHSGEMKRFTYNSVNTVTQVTEDRKRVSLPTMGFYMKYVPLTAFECFLIGRRSANVIRLGKKLAPVRVYYQKLENLRIHDDGEFVPSHSVNATDLPEETRTLECTLEVIPPIPLFRTCRLRGRHLTGTAMGKEYTIALPEEGRYPCVFSDHASAHRC